MARSTRSWAVVAVFGVAIAARLLPVLRGGGLFGLTAYDDGVYYGSAVGLVNGRLPYRDFLLLHPPGITLALAPFAAVGRRTTEGIGFAGARLAWMVLGGCTAVLVTVVLRRVGTVAAVAGGLSYAVYYPAVHVERTTLLEGLGNACLAGAVVLVVRAQASAGGPRPRDVWLLGAAGALLGASSAVKIWGVVPALLVIGFVAATATARRAAVVLAGAIAAGVVICLPFLLAAPAAMWRMVVLDQLQRPETGVPVLNRLDTFLGQSLHPAHQPRLLLVTAIAVLAVAGWLAWSQDVGRLAVLLLAGITALLLLTPSYFTQYAGAIAVPVALVLGVASARVAAWSSGRSRWAAPAAATAGLLLLAGYGGPLLISRTGTRFPATALSGVTRRLPGCVSSDHAATLVELDVLGRNIRRSCPLVVDLGGNSYDLSRGMPTVRTLNGPFQQLALRYLSSADATVLARFSAGHGLSEQSYRTVTSWPVLLRADGYVLRRPVPLPG